MATYAAKTGTQNFTDTWALIDATSANITEGSATTYTNSSTSYTSCPAFTTPGVGTITIDGIGIYIAKTNFITTYPIDGTAYSLGTLSIRLAQAGVPVTGTVVTVNVEKLKPKNFGVSFTYDFTDKIVGGWVFIKFDSSVTLATSTAYTVDILTSVGSSVQIGTSAVGTNWLRYLRTTSTGTPAAGDRLFICGELNSSGTWSTNTINHNSTDSSTSYGRVDIGAYGEWIWNNLESTNYYFKTSGDIRIGDWGKLQIGTTASPIPETSTATIDFVSSGNAGCTLNCARKSIVTMCGTEKTHMGYLQSNITAGASTATVSASSSSLIDPNWKSGDLVTFSSYHTGASAFGDALKTDEVTLNANSASGVITWSTSKNNLGNSQATSWYAHQTSFPWVANLTRNIKIKGTSTTNTCQISVNSDLFNLTAVEMYFIDGLRLGCGENVVFRKIKNCVLRDSRNANFSQSGGAGSIFLSDTKNILVENCVVSRANGIQSVTVAPVSSESGYGQTTVKNCIVINSTAGGNVLFRSAHRNPVIIDNCIFTSCAGSFNITHTTNSSTTQQFLVKNCQFGILGSGGTIIGGEPYWQTLYGRMSNDVHNYGLMSNCVFHQSSLNLAKGALRFDNCIFKLYYSISTAGWLGSNTMFFLMQGGNTTSSVYDKDYPYMFNNCTFTVNTPGANGGFTSGAGYAIFNGGSCDQNAFTGNGFGTWTGGTLVFNNFNFSQTPTTVTGIVTSGPLDLSPGFYTAPSSGNGSRGGFIKFQKFNGIEGDHRTYSGTHMIFSDNTIYDSSPKSVKIYSCASQGEDILPIKIPLKKNQTATVSFKVKLSEPANVYSPNKYTTAFFGKVPALHIKANSALGINYSNDIWYYPNEAINGSPDTGFTPASLGDNLRLWVDASDLSSITYDSITGTVSQWNDKSGLNNHLIQTAEEKKPLIHKDFEIGNGGYPISFGGIQNQRLITSNNILNGTTAEMEFFMVLAGSSSNKGIKGEYFGFEDTTPMVAFDPSGAYTYIPGMACGLGRSGNTVIGTTNESYAGDNAIHLWHLTNSVANSQRRININGIRGGSTLGNAQDATTVNITPTKFSLGASQESTSDTGNQYGSASFYVYEIVVVNKKMSSDEINNMNKYLCNKWNIALRSNTTTWKTVTYTLPAPSDDTVIEAWINVAGHKAGNLSSYNFATGWINIDSIKVT